MSQGIVNTASKWTRITTGTTTQIATTAAVLDGLVLPDGTTGTITIYDDPDSNDNPVVVFPASTPAGVYPIGAYMLTGLRVVTSAADQVIVLSR